MPDQHTNELPLVTVYHSRDPIEHLRLRIRIRAAPSRPTIKVPQTAKARALQAALLAQSQAEPPPPPSPDTATIVQWQQKIPSLDSIRALTQPHNLAKSSRATAFLQDKYPTLPVAEAATNYVSELPPVYVFTVIDDDQYIDDRLYNQTIVNNSNSVFRRSVNDWIHHHKLVKLARSQCQSMIVQACLASNSEAKPVILCEVRKPINDSHDDSIEMRPGFSPTDDSDDTGWYVVYIHNQCYEYRIENETELVYLRSLANNDSDHATKPLAVADTGDSTTLDHWFVSPPRGTVLCNYFVEICYATNFHCDSLYIQWKLLLPKVWQVFNDSADDSADDNDKREHRVVAEGCSQISRSVWRQTGLYRAITDTGTDVGTSNDSDSDREVGEVTDNDDIRVHHFNLPLSFALLAPDTIDALSSLPSLTFQCNSVGRFDVHRIEGFGSTVLPSLPGETHSLVQCFHALGSWRERLTISFLGGGLHMENDDWNKVSRETANRAATEIVGSGVVAVRSELIVTHNSSSSSSPETGSEPMAVEPSSPIVEGSSSDMPAKSLLRHRLTKSASVTASL